MIIPKDEQWAKWGIHEEHQKFFIARWHEIFDEETFDTWQVRSSNIRSILKEILDACKVVEDVHVYHHNISALISEAEHVAHTDFIIKEYFPFAISCLEKIRKSYDSNVKDERKIDLDSFNRLVKVLLGNLNDYRTRVIECLRDLMLNPPVKYKIHLYYLTMSFAVELRLAGFSISALRNSLHILLDTNEIKFINRLNNLIQVFSRPRQDYSCIFLISWPRITPDLSKYGIEFSTSRPKPLFKDEEKEFYGQDEQALLATVKIQAFDPFDARNRAQELLERYFSVNKLYSLSNESKIRQKKALIIDSLKALYLVPEDTSRLGYIKDSKRPQEGVEKFAQILGRLPESDAGQLYASLQHHKLSLVASTDEARLVNLWIALETLVQDGSKNIIEKISRYIPSSDATGYVTRIARVFPVSFLRYWRSIDTAELCEKLKYSNKHILDLRDVIAILLDKNEGSLITGFFSFTKNNPLLAFRTHRLWDKTFGNPTVMAHKIENHQKNTDWQIRRIYRARNIIIHQGCCPLGARQLIQHLHTYYINVIHNLIHDLEVNPEWSIADSHEYRIFLYETFLSKLRKYKENPFSAECILEPKRLLGRTEGPPAWDSEKLKEDHNS